MGRLDDGSPKNFNCFAADGKGAINRDALFAEVRGVFFQAIEERKKSLADEYRAALPLEAVSLRALLHDDAENARGFSLQQAFLARAFNVAQSMIARGAAVDLGNPTALQMAVRSDDKSGVKFFLQHRADPFLQNSATFNALSAALLTRSSEAIAGFEEFFAERKNSAVLLELLDQEQGFKTVCGIKIPCSGKRLEAIVEGRRDGALLHYIREFRARIAARVEAEKAPEVVIDVASAAETTSLLPRGFSVSITASPASSVLHPEASQVRSRGAIAR